jgi:hypothetical protein
LACVVVFIIECLQLTWKAGSEGEELARLSIVTHNDDSRSAAQDETSKNGAHSDGSRESLNRGEEENIGVGY